MRCPETWTFHQSSQDVNPLPVGFQGFPRIAPMRLGSSLPTRVETRPLSRMNARISPIVFSRSEGFSLCSFSRALRALTSRLAVFKNWLSVCWLQLLRPCSRRCYELSALCYLLTPRQLPSLHSLRCSVCSFGLMLQAVSEASGFSSLAGRPVSSRLQAPYCLEVCCQLLPGRLQLPELVR